MITMKDIHRLYHLPIHNHRIQHTMDRDNARSIISYLYGANIVDMIMFEIHLREIRYYQYW